MEIAIYDERQRVPQWRRRHEWRRLTLVIATADIVTFYAVSRDQGLSRFTFLEVGL